MALSRITHVTTVPHLGSGCITNFPVVAPSPYPINVLGIRPQHPQWVGINYNVKVGVSVYRSTANSSDFYVFWHLESIRFQRPR